MSGDSIRKMAVQFRREAATLDDRASQVVRKVAMDTEADAKRLAPVDTGNLRNSITMGPTERNRPGNISYEVKATANYAVHQELGTSKMPPQPFMGPATDRHTPEFYEAMKRLGGQPE